MDRREQATGIDRQCFLMRGTAAGTWALAGPLCGSFGGNGLRLQTTDGQAVAAGGRLVAPLSAALGNIAS